MSHAKILYLSLFILSACTSSSPDLSKVAAQEITDADKAMSALAAKEGFHKALLQYADEDVVKPEANRHPIIGKKALEVFWANTDDTKTLTWEPFRAEAAASGELGYTIGNWKLELNDTTLYGNYYTTWKKKDGVWKFTMDAGNPTPPPEH